MDERSPSPGPDVSVIIPFYGDPAELGQCLEHLAEQLGAPPYEVLVIDNAAPECPEAVVAAYPFARLLDEPAPGSYRARNRGVRAARGRILAFTDSDCRPTPGWLAAACARVESELDTIGFVTGPVELFVAGDEEPNLFELWDLTVGFPQERYLERHGFGVTANLVTSRETMARVGPFRDELRSSGDKEWCQRAATFGLRGCFDPNVVVRHPCRRSWPQIRRKAARVAAGDADLRRIRGQRRRPPLPLSRALVPPLRLAWRRARRASDRRAVRIRFFGLALLVWYVQRFEERRAVWRRSSPR